MEQPTKENEVRTFCFYQIINNTNSYVEATENGYPEDRNHIDEGLENQQKTESVEMDVNEKESGSTEDIEEENEEDEENEYSRWTV